LGKGRLDPLVMELLLFDPFMAKVILVSLSELKESKENQIFKSDVLCC
jgi:hypothetical protein